MKTQTILDKFEAVSTTIDVIEKENGDYFTFNEFGVVPVRCDIRYLWDGEEKIVELLKYQKPDIWKLLKKINIVSMVYFNFIFLH